jgi:hypothetical protein
MKKKELTFPLIFMAFAVAYLIASLGYPRKSAMFPQVLIGFIILLSVIVIIKAWAGKNERSEEKSARDLGLRQTLRQRLRRFETQRAIVLCGGILLYFVLASIAGFVLTNFVVLTGLMVMLGARWIPSICNGVTITVMFHFFFREYLHVPIPNGPGEWLFQWLKYTFFR